MLLNYLYANFYEEADFLRVAKLTRSTLAELLHSRTMPDASYVLGCNTQAVSFVGNYDDRQIYRFHLKGHLNWLNALMRLTLDSEERARSYFEQEYSNSKALFFAGQLGQDFLRLAPDLRELFDEAKSDATWQNFLAGVYGVCTRDGQPGTIFLKQVGVAFIERLTQASGPADLSAEQQSVIRQAVTFLERVESDFAPHEVAQTSRQRCIIDVTERFLMNHAA
jgi:hypothetical protein